MLYISLIVILFLSFNLTALASDTTKTTFTKETLNNLNQADSLFEQIYQDKVSNLVSHNKPFIVIFNDDLYVYDKDNTIKKQLVPNLYHALKSVDHIPLAVYVLLDKVTKLDEDKINTLNSLLQYIDLALDDFNKNYTKDSTIDLQLRILKVTKNYVKTLISQKYCDQEQLNYFASNMSQMLMLNADAATNALLHNLDDIMNQLNYSKQAKEKLHVVIYTAHMARKEMCLFQYFEKYFNEKYEGNHIVLIEDSNSIDDGIKLLGKHLVDTDISKGFFDCPMRMHEDLLYESAKKYLKNDKSI